MIFEYLVRNYYKRHGSFSGIMSTYLAKPLNDYTQKYKLTQDSLLYSTLGMHEILITAHGLTARVNVIDFFTMQQSYYLGDVDTINRILRRVEMHLTADDCKKLFTVFDQFSAKFFGVLNEYKAQKEKCEFPLYVDMLYTYCTKSFDRYLFKLPDKSETVLSFSEYLNFMIMSNKMITKKALLNMDVLPAIQSCPDIEMPIIINKKLLVPEKLTEVQIKKIHTDVCISLEKLVGLQKLFGHASLMQLAFLDHINYQSYVRMQTSATALGVSYSDFISNFGMLVPNQLDIFSALGMLVYKLEDEVMCAFHDIEKDQYVECSNPIAVSDFSLAQLAIHTNTTIDISVDTISNACEVEPGSKYHYDLDKLLQTAS